MNVFLAVVKTGFYSVEFYSVALVSILCSVISTFYYIRIIKILYFENNLIGNLFHPINTSKTTVLSFLLFSLPFLFFNPTLLYLLTYKISYLLLSIDCFLSW